MEKRKETTKGATSARSRAKASGGRRSVRGWASFSELDSLSFGFRSLGRNSRARRTMAVPTRIRKGRARTANPTHPYTKALLRSIPVLGRGKNQQLEPIRGVTPDPFNRPKGCQFCPRCDYACEKCETEMPGEEWVNEGHYTRCFNYREVMADGK